MGLARVLIVQVWDIAKDLTECVRGPPGPNFQTIVSLHTSDLLRHWLTVQRHALPGGYR